MASRGADSNTSKPTKQVEPSWKAATNDVPSPSALFDTALEALRMRNMHPPTNTEAHKQARRRSAMASPPPRPPRPEEGLGFLAEPAIMEASLENRLDSASNRRNTSWDGTSDMSQLIRETDMAFRSGRLTDADGPNSLDLPRESEDNMSRSNPDLTQLAPSPLVIEKPTDKGTTEENSEAEAQIPPAIPPRRSSRAKDGLEVERRKSHSVPPPTNIRNPPSPRAGIDGHNPSPLLPAAPEPILESPINTPANSHNQTPPLKLGDISHRFQRQSPPRPRRPSKTARWAIPDNVTDILTGNVFKRRQVHELLTPEQVVLLKHRREEKARRKEEELEARRYSGGSENAQGPSGKEEAAGGCGDKSHKNQPSHSSSLPSPGSQPSQGDVTEREASGSASETSAASDDVARSSEEKQQSSVSEDDEEDRPPTPPMKSERRLQKQAAEAKKAGTDKHDADEGLKTVDFLEVPTPFDELDIPILPAKNPRRYSRLPEKELPALPKQESSKKAGDKVSVLFAPEEDDEFFYLKSTPYSLTAPSFRHGRIALAKSEVGKGAPTMDETLDWTAFQMAILGAGEFLSDLYDEVDGKLVEDIKEWYGDLGLETYGLLIPETWESSPRSSQSSLSSLEEHDLPSPHQAQDLGFDAARLFQGKNRQWQPQSQGAFSEQPEVVEEDGIASMGYNLQDDLGNFLQWEAQYAVSPGYYGL